MIFLPAGWMELLCWPGFGDNKETLLKVTGGENAREVCFQLLLHNIVAALGERDRLML